jgi:hypothetical protein
VPFRPALLAAALTLPGCHTIHDLVGVDPNPVASEIHKYDGSYQGPIRQIVARSRTCPAEHGERVLMIGDGTLWYAYTPDIVFTSPVTRDGTIIGQAGTTALTGKIIGNHLVARIKNPDCETSISAYFVYNH